MRKPLLAMSMGVLILTGCSHSQSSVPQPVGITQSFSNRSGVSPDSPPKRYVIVYSFQGGVDGASPAGRLVLDDAGNLYGTTGSGGNGGCDFGCGTVYKIDQSGHKTILHSFVKSTSDGKAPAAGLARDPAGNLYGTTLDGGASCQPRGCGVVFKIDSNGNETVLHSFDGSDGQAPQAGVILDSAGNLYGTTEAGGASNAGVVFKIRTNGAELVLHSFNGTSDGGALLAGVIRDAAGNLYGTTNLGGSSHQGVVYKLNPRGNETVLHNFTGPDGAVPSGGVVRDSAGDLFGATFYGGTTGNGAVYKVAPGGNETVLQSFHFYVGGPTGDLARPAGGNLYGTTVGGGPSNAGEVYMIGPEENLTVLHVFTIADGCAPNGDLIRDSAGNLYGTTSGGGSAGHGVVFELTH